VIYNALLQHAVCISLGLEAHVFGMTPSDFYDITSQHIAGSNPDVQKAEVMRTVLIPDRMIVPGSSPHYPRTIRILAAFISAEWVYVVSDFSGLARLHVRSKAIPWSEGDLLPGSDVNNCSPHRSSSCLSSISIGTNSLEPSEVGQIGCLSLPSRCQPWNGGDRRFLRNITSG
jgi:hypothetical protein